MSITKSIPVPDPQPRRRLGTLAADVVALSHIFNGVGSACGVGIGFLVTVWHYAILINIGARQRGYCAHYARDIGTKLKELRLKTLYLHWGAADAGTRLEHNVIIVTAPDQDYRTGYIIDGWRNAGRLCWWPVLKDSSYVWKEDLKETAWLHDYELVQQKAAPQPKTVALQSKSAVQPKSSPQPKAAVEARPLVPRKTETAAATIEIKG